MSATPAAANPNALRHLAAETLREEAGTWLFVLRAALSLFITGWLAMRLALPQPSTAMLTTVIVMNRQTGMVLAKSFYRALGTLAGAAAALVIMGLFPQERVLFLLATASWVGMCAGGAMLYRNFRAYGFVLSGYTAAIVALPALDDPLNTFASAVARISEVLLGILVSGVISDTVFPSRMRDALRRAAREQFANFLDFVRQSTGGKIGREAIEQAHLRAVREAVAIEDLRSSVIFEDAEARARSGHLQLLNQRFMAASTSLQSLQHLIGRLRRVGQAGMADRLLELYRPLGDALDAPAEAGIPALALLPRLETCRERMAQRVAQARAGLDGGTADFDTGAVLLLRFVDELYAYVQAAAAVQVPRLAAGSAEHVQFARSNDFLSAGFTALTTTLAMLALGAFWISSAWPNGAAAMTLAAAFCGLFASAPNPARSAWHVLIGYALGMSAGFVVEFFVLARMDGYGLMVAGTLPLFVLGPWLSQRLSIVNVGVGYGMGYVYILALSNPMQYDVVRFINDAIAQLVAVGAAMMVFVVAPLTGSRWYHRRQFEQLRRQVAFAAEAPLPGLLYRFESANRDLLQQIVARTPQGSAGPRALVAWALAVHETGRALIELRQAMAGSGATPAQQAAVGRVVERLAQFYGRPDAARYLAARTATQEAIAAAQPQLAAVLGHLHLIRMALLDGESVIADYMPKASAAATSSSSASENPHAP